MDFTDVTNYFTKNSFYLNYFGLFLNNFSLLSIWYKVYWFITHVLLMGIFNLCLLVNWMLNSTSLEGFASAGYVILTCVMGQVKIILLISKKKDILRLVELFKQEHFWPQNQEEWNIVYRELLNYKKLRKMILFSAYLSIFSSILNPYFDKKDNILPIPAWYPIDVTVSLRYTIALTHQQLSIFLVGSGYTFVDIMFGSILTYAGLQCDILSLRIKKLVDKNGLIHNRRNMCMLINCVAHHWGIIKFLETTDQIFGNIYFWQFLASTLTLCMDLFLLSVTDPSTFEFFYLLVYWIAIAVLLLVPCWFASEMTRKSESIPIAAYSCEWMDASPSFKKDLVFLIQRSQQPMKLYAGKFFEISVLTFSKIIRTSLSYFAVLNNLNT